VTEPWLVSAGPRTERRIAITFDDGPSTTTPHVFEALEAHEAKATFFVIGRWVEQLPDTVAEAARLGHEIGNHTWTHIDGDRTRELETLREEVDRTNDAIERVLGRPPRLMRPPYGSDPGRFARVAAECGLSATVLWSVQSFDWQDPDDPDEIVGQVLAEVEPGAIVLLHDGQRETNDAAPRPATRAALPTLLERLRADDFEFVTVSELLDTLT
jgi:peptidoglycan/xylan/chitin deacetylase (PgdA/CDA1 family)